MNLSFFDDKPDLNDLDFKLPLIHDLKNVNINEMVNIMFYGINASGKTTKVYALLASMFNKTVYNLKNIEIEEDKKVMIYRASEYHIEVNSVSLGSNEKLFISSFLKNYVQSRNIGLNLPKIVYIKNAELLSKQSLMSLRKIIEKSVYTAKFIFEVNSLSKIPDAILSRFLLVRVKMPTKIEIKNCLIDYSMRKKINIKNEEIDEIINNSCKISNILNLKKIFGFYRYFVCTNKKFSFLYYDYFFEIFQYMNKKISFVTIQKIRDIVNEMYINLIPMEELMIFLFEKFCEKYNNDIVFIGNLMKITTDCDNLLKAGNKKCLHLEYYIISIIDLLH